MHIRNSLGLTLAAVSLAGLAGPALAGPDWLEQCDAGSDPQTAQAVNVSGDVKTIHGRLAPCPDSDGGPNDFEDMYLIRVSQPTVFCARTVLITANFDCCGQPIDLKNGTTPNFNTQLWIFRADGRGLLGNDDNPGDPPRSLLHNAATDGSGAVLVQPGLYYLAISGGSTSGGRDPVSPGGPIFFQQSPFEISGPDGQGGTIPISGWNGIGAQGEYLIVLCGVTGVPTIPTVTEWGLIILGGLVAVAGCVILARDQRRRAAAHLVVAK